MTTAPIRCANLTVNSNKAAAVLIDLGLGNFQCNSLIQQRPAVLVDEVFAAVRVGMISKSCDGADEIIVFNFPDYFHQTIFELILAEPLSAGEIELQGRIWCLLLTDHSILKLVALQEMTNDVVKKLEEVGL